MCAKENWVIKGYALLKKIMYDFLIFMNDFSEDSSELPEKSIVHFNLNLSQAPNHFIGITKKVKLLSKYIPILVKDII